LPDARVGQDVERRVLDAERVEGPRGAHREAAGGLLGRALHEEHHLVLVDRLLQKVADLVVRHALLPGVDVLIERAWIGPPICAWRSRAAAAQASSTSSRSTSGTTATRCSTSTGSASSSTSRACATSTAPRSTTPSR